MKIDLDALSDITYGLYIVGANSDGKPNAMIANSVLQVSANPVKLAACINKNCLTHDYIMKSRMFCAQAIKQGADLLFIGNYGFRAGRDFDKFARYKYRLTQNNLPAVLENTLDIFEVKVDTVVDLGTHTFFAGPLLSAEILDEGEPLTYAYYHTVLRGKTPRGATTFKEN